VGDQILLPRITAQVLQNMFDGARRRREDLSWLKLFRDEAAIAACQRHIALEFGVLCAVKDEVHNVKLVIITEADFPATNRDSWQKAVQDGKRSG
jgi:hypothetical protein